MIKPVHKKIFYLLLLVCCACAIAYGMFSDAPLSRRPTETEQIDFALKYGSWDFNPHHFMHPPFFSYILFFVYGASFFIGMLLRVFNTLGDFHLFFYTNPLFFYILARITVLVMALCSLILVYKIAKMLFKKEAIAFLSALFLAALPVFIIASHYAAGDLPLLFMSLAAFYFIAKVFLAGATTDYFLAGIFTGLAIATKYNAGILVCGLVYACISSGRPLKKEVKKVLLGLLSVAAGFIIGCPFALLDYRSFSSGLARTFQRSRLDSYNFLSWKADKPGWIYIWTNTFPFAMGALFTFLAAASIIISLLKRDKRINILLAIIIPYILYTGTWTMIKPRYFLHIAPFMCMVSAFVVYGFMNKIVYNRRAFVAAILFLLVIFAPNVYAIMRFDRSIGTEPVYVSAKKWIESNVAIDEKIAVSESVCLMPNENSIDRQMDEIRRKNIGEGVALKDMRNYLWAIGRKYDVYALPLPWMENFDSQDFDFNALRRLGIRYFVIADEFDEYMKNPSRYKLQCDFLGDVKNKGTLLKEFKKIKPQMEPELSGGAYEYVQIYRFAKQ